VQPRVLGLLGRGGGGALPRGPTALFSWIELPAYDLPSAWKS
jgi:hypothetical protein